MTNQLWIHAVWGTKNRSPFLTNDVRSKIIDHIKENAQKKNIFIDRLNGYTEHLHCLMVLEKGISVSKAMQHIKGESAFWMNRNKIIEDKFEWADDYFAAIVNEPRLPFLRTYIDNQEEHHKKISFNEEYKRFLKMAG